MAVLLVVPALACSDDPAGSDDVSAAVAVLVTDPSDPAVAFADVVELVARDGISDEDAAIVAANLEDHLDTLGDSAMNGGPITRPDTVRFFTALLDHGPFDTVHQAIANWTVSLVAPAIADHAPIPDIEAQLPPAVEVLAAAHDGFNRTEPQRDHLLGRVNLYMQIGVSEIAADAHGLPRPGRGEFSDFNTNTLGTDVVTPFTYEALVLAESLDDDDPWAVETRT